MLLCKVVSSPPASMHCGKWAGHWCCWWNPRAAFSEERTLAHQQVHFALVELAARELQAEREQLIRTLRGEGRDAQEAVDALQRRWGRTLTRALDDLHDGDERYDRETKHGNEDAAQAAWAARTARE